MFKSDSRRTLKSETTESPLKTWKFNIRRNVSSDFSRATMSRVAIIFFELRVVKSFMQKFNRKTFHDYCFV